MQLFMKVQIPNFFGAPPNNAFIYLQDKIGLFH